MENKKVAIIISPNWQDYAQKYLADCIKSLRHQDYQGKIKVFIIDNETSEESYILLKKIAPEAEIHRNKHNDGFAKGNNDAIKLALGLGYEYIILFNMDTIIESNCVSELIKVADSDNKTGAVQARLMLWPEKEKINSLGNVTHFLGFGYSLGYREKIDKAIFKISDIAYPSGAAVLYKAGVLRKVGLFDEEFWMYNEDQDLGWRIWLAGFKCVLAPQAVVYHKYEFAKSTKQYYWMDRNRILAIKKNYHPLTLLLIFPASIIMELGLLLFAMKVGCLKEKLKVYKYFFTPSKWLYIYQSRKQTQKLRKVKDKDIVKMFSGRIWYQEIDDAKLKLVNPVFNLYWRVIKRLIVW
jgi:GT2 family glycosyltransferase